MKGLTTREALEKLHSDIKDAVKTAQNHQIDNKR